MPDAPIREVSATSSQRGQMKNARYFFFADLLLHARKEARRREHADERLFGCLCRDTRRSGGALDSRQLARDLRRVLTLHRRAHAGGRGETVDLRPAATGFVTVQVRLG